MAKHQHRDRKGAARRRSRDQPREDPRGRDPIAEYIEWTQNRYNPGHWLGGNAPPLRRRSLSAKGRRHTAVFLGIVALAETIRWIAAIYAGRSDWGALATAVLFALAVIGMFRSSGTPDSK